jgi:NADH:ubiquinone oxidoreductase subunit 5 (subunit L)/multisubunit Na+/H+ antiporter MnhA subunit/multisubunit Na+/H+ antiporter MnhB subunit
MQPDTIANLTLLSLLLPWLAMALLLIGGPWARRSAPARWIWLIPASITALFALFVAHGAGTEVQFHTVFTWVADLGIAWTLQIDGLSLFFGLVVAGMGTLIYLYTAGYFAEKPGEFRKFYTYLLLFLAAMLGTVFSGNLLILYVWWELTGIASFFLIGYLHKDEEARNGARMALITTITTGMCLLAGILVIGLTAGTFDIAELLKVAPEHAQSPAWTVGFILILLGAFGKSAQFPFHYWLPNAMAAPTPVSAYLHSATMVKLGIFLIARIFPIFRPLDAWVPILVLIGFFTFLLGATLSLRSNKLKAILAFSTVSQLGFLVGFYGITPVEGAHWDLLHIINHVFYKGALFMVVGIIDHATHTKDIRQLGGLRRRMPLLFWITLFSSASMAGVVFTSGFLSKEYLLKEKLDYLFDGTFLNFYPILMVIIGSVFKVAFSIRLVTHCFLGEENPKTMAHFHKPSFFLQLPPLILTVFTLTAGILPGLFSKVLFAFQVPGLHATDTQKLKLWHGIDSPAFLISCGILVAGAILYSFAQRDGWKFTTIPKFIRFDAAFAWAIDRLPAFGGSVSRALGVDHPKYHGPVILTVALLWIGIPLLNNLPLDWLPAFSEGERLMSILAAGLIVFAGTCLLIVHSWKAQVILMGGIGFLITFYFVLYRAPDLALTQILVESATLILLLVLLLRFPSLRHTPLPLPRGTAAVNLVIAILTGLLAFVLTLVFSGAPSSNPLGAAYLEASLPKAKGTNAVNTILVDFRGFDTLLEIGVLTIATLGIAGLLTRRKGGSRDA